MKKLLITPLVLIVLGGLKANSQTRLCCSTSNSEFAMLGKSREFQTAHLTPEPILFQAGKGMMVAFPTSDEVSGKAYSVPASGKSNNYLFVFHEWWGLNDHIKQEAEKLAEELPGVNVMAIDLYDGLIAADAEEAGRIMQSIKQERAEAIIKGAINFIRADAVIQTIGWCFGGGWSMQAAIIAGVKSKGCIIYYGMPEKDDEKLKNFNVPVLGIFATNDSWINKDVVGNFEKQMNALKKNFKIHWFEAEHAFANPSNPKHDIKAAGEARKISLEFLKKNY